MNIVKEELSKTSVKMTVEVLPEEMQPYLDKAVERISKEVKVDGFRPGKAPYDMLAKKVGEMEIYQEAARDVVDDTLPKAVKEQEIDFVGQPQISIEKIAPGNGISYSAEFALMPEVKLGDYKSLKVEKETKDLEDDKWKETLEQLRKLHAESKPVEREAKEGDQVVVDFNVKKDGVDVEGGQGTNQPIVIGDKQFIPGFEEQVVGMKQGDEKEFKLTFPEEYGAKHLAGQECDFTVKLQTVNEVELPELNDEFAKKLNFESMAKLEEQIKDNIKRELDMEADQKYEVAVLDAVLEQAEFDPIPDMMMNNEKDRMMHELEEQVQQQGGRMNDYLEHIGKTEEDLREGWTEQAEKRIKGALVMKAVGEAEDVKIAESDIDAEVARYKEMYKDLPEQQAQFDGFEFRAYVRSILRNQKVVDNLKEYAAS